MCGQTTKDKISLDDAIFRLLETCFSIKEDKAETRIHDLLYNLYPSVCDFSIIPPYRKEERDRWRLRVIWKTGMKYVAADMWIENVTGGFVDHIEWVSI